MHSNDSTRSLLETQAHHVKLHLDHHQNDLTSLLFNTKVSSGKHCDFLRPPLKTHHHRRRDSISQVTTQIGTGVSFRHEHCCIQLFNGTGIEKNTQIEETVGNRPSNTQTRHSHLILKHKDIAPTNVNDNRNDLKYEACPTPAHTVKEPSLAVK